MSNKDAPWLSKELQKRFSARMNFFNEKTSSGENQEDESQKNHRKVIEEVFFFILKFSQDLIQEKTLWTTNEQIRKEFLLILNYIPLFIFNNQIKKYDQFENIMRKMIFIMN